MIRIWLVQLTLVGHVTLGALWLGSMSYSLFVLQPKLPRMLGIAPDGATGGDSPDGGTDGAPDGGTPDAGAPDAVERAQQVLASGNRRPVSVLIAALWLTGTALVLFADDRPDWWWAIVAGKAGLLAAATWLFWWVSWRGWPARVFALPDELPGLRRRFRRVAVAMFALVGAAFLAGFINPR